MIDYIPKQGDIITLDLKSNLSNQKLEFKYAVVISNNVFNIHTKMAIVCPITSNDKYFPTHYILEDTRKVNGSVLCEHIRSIDYESRNVRFVEHLSDNDLLSITTLMNACIEE